MGAGIDASCQQSLGLVAEVTGHLEGNEWIGSETQGIHFPFETVKHPPQLAAVRGDVDIQPATVEMLVDFAGAFEVFNGSIGQWHV